jgi:molybdenum cofactor synthesis domain-containing protein
MTPEFPSATRALVITVSDRSFAGARQDLSGPAISALLRQAGISSITSQIVPDELDMIVTALRQGAQTANLVVTTGGTGLAPRDVTPEATRIVCERIVEGLAETMRSVGIRQTPLAALSRAVCGTVGATLIVNLPGNPRGAETSLQSILPLLPHALQLLRGDTSHGSDPASK